MAIVRRDRDSVAREAEDKLRKILNHAYDTSPYYRSAWDAMGFRPSLSFTSQDLRQLPLLTKDILRQHKAFLVSEHYSIDQLVLSYTGGTTGTQTPFYLDRACKISRVGRQWGMLELCGYQPGMRRALVWGVHDDLPPDNARRSLRQRFRHYASGEETLCCNVLNDRLLGDYHERLLRFRPEVLYGYPSALAQLGRVIEEKRLEPIRVRRIITTAERLSGARRRQLMRAFGGEVFNLYCTREHGCIGFECRRHQGFHIDAGSVFIEVVKDGQRVEPGRPGEIVVTDLLNYGMPFIRSRTGDMGIYSPQPCECGSPLPVLKCLDGRTSDLLYRPDGSVVPGIMLTDLFIDLPSIRYSQFAQERVEQLDVRMVVTEALSEQVRREIVRQVRELMGDEIAIQIKVVDEIERNPRSGKLREILCTVKAPDIGRPAGNGFVQEHEPQSG